MARPSALPIHPRDLILTSLRKSRSPLSAYALLAKLKSKGIKSPMIIYRALAELEKLGTVHKIQAIGAYVACNCSSDHTHPLSVLTVCNECKDVKELHEHTIIDYLSKLHQMGVNLLPTAVIELPIMCKKCAV